MGERRGLVEIDLSAVGTAGQLHEVLAAALGFPAWYGANWDAFWDGITGLVAMPRRLRLAGWAGLAARLPREAELMRQCLDDMTRMYPAQAAAVEYT